MAKKGRTAPAMAAERREKAQPPAPAPEARELAVIKISSDSGLMHEMMPDDCRRRRLIMVQDLAMHNGPLIPLP